MADQLAFTRDKFKAEVAVRLGEALGTDGGGNPVTSDADIDQVVSKICRATDCFFWGGTTGPGAYGTEIIANQIDYCAVPLYKIVAMTAADQAGNVLPLSIFAQREFDKATGNYWRATGSGTSANFHAQPAAAYLKGENSFGLYPVPDYNSVIWNYTDIAIGVSGTITSALRPFTSADQGKVINVTGGPLDVNGAALFNYSRFVIMSVDGAGNASVAGTIGTPGSAGGIGAFGTGGISISGYGFPGPWPNATDVCPLQTKNHEAVMLGLCVRRLLTSRSSRDKETRDIARDLMPEYNALYQEALGDIEAESATIAQHSEPGVSWLG